MSMRVTMKIKSLLTALVAVFLLSGKSHAWSSVTGPDYSRDAPSIYYCASTGTVTTQAGVSVSSPVISLFNPLTSGKNLVLMDVGVTPTASPAASVVFELAYNIVPSTGIQSGTGATGNVTSALIGTSTSTATSQAQGVCKVQGILPALPVAFRYIGGTTGAAAISGTVFTDLTQGKVVLPPGGLVSIQTSSAANLLAHLVWREDPI